MKLWRKGIIYCGGVLLVHGVSSYLLKGNTSLVSWGTRGELVLKTQEKLKELGYYRGTPDGVYGSKTYEAISAFQRATGLKADGIAGAETLLYLGIDFTGAKEEVLKEIEEEEVLLLASVIHGEARGEPYEGQVAVGAVVLNRVGSSDFPDSIGEVIYQQGAFDAVQDGQINLTPNADSIRAAKDAIAGWDPVDGALYYWNPVTATSRWIWSIPITGRIGRHVFG